MHGISIRMRLTMWYSAVLFLGLAGFGAGMSIALEHRLIKGVDEMLEQRVDGVRTTLELEGQLSREQLQLELSEFARETPEGGLIELRDDRGWNLLPDPKEPAAPRFSMEPTGFRTESRNGRLYRVLSAGFTLAGHHYRTVVVGSLAGLHAVLLDFRRFLLLMIPGVLAVAGLGGYWISRRALAPVDEITRVATSISVHSLARRLDVPKTHDEIQRMSEAWNGVLERLEGAVKRIQQFTADASHELRTPIALIRASAELSLRRARSAGEYQETLRRIQSEAEHITGLTESLLTLARADANDAAMPLNRTDIPAVVASVMTQVEASAAEKGIRIESRSDADQAIAMANEPALRRLLLILLDNALKHTPRGGQVVITTTRTDAGVRLDVADNGEGIPVEAAPHVFERFYRADTARGSGSGAGLGLSIAQAIAHAHRSAISVESEPGKGARFAFTLPV
jgi:two-component system heavy metal sensor histidine kinase CusS